MAALDVDLFDMAVEAARSERKYQQMPAAPISDGSCGRHEPIFMGGFLSGVCAALAKSSGRPSEVLAAEARELAAREDR